MHPLIGDLSKLSDTDLDEKTRDLRRKYFMVRNPEVQAQILAALQDHEEETKRRQALAFKRMQEKDDEGLDDLINIS